MNGYPVCCHTPSGQHEMIIVRLFTILRKEPEYIHKNLMNLLQISIFKYLTT